MLTSTDYQEVYIYFVYLPVFQSASQEILSRTLVGLRPSPSTKYSLVEIEVAVVNLPVDSEMLSLDIPFFP